MLLFLIFPVCPDGLRLQGTVGHGRFFKRACRKSRRSRGGDLLKEYQKLNRTPFILGAVVVGLEAGFLYAYKAGWQVSKASLVQSTFLAVALLFAGRLIYGEELTWNKLLGAAVCLIGLAIINYR